MLVVGGLFQISAFLIQFPLRFLLHHSVSVELEGYSGVGNIYISVKKYKLIIVQGRICEWFTAALQNDSEYKLGFTGCVP